MVPFLPSAQLIPAVTGAALASVLPLALTSLAVRWLHVLAATVVVGGSLLTWLLLHVSDDTEHAVTVARGYEWLFWAGVGTLAMTGVGNLGAFAPTLPAGNWRATLDVKLGLFVVVLVGSAVRVQLLARLRQSADPTGGRRLQTAYGATVVGLVALLALAEVLAHG